MKFTSATGRERLLRTHPTTAQKTFDDLLHSCATTIEDALITSGLEPGVDYKAMDIFALANPLAMKLMHREGAQITVGYPDDHPHAGLRQDHELNEAEKAIMARIIKRPACNKSSLSAWVKTQADNYPLAGNFAAACGLQEFQLVFCLQCPALPMLQAFLAFGA